MLIQLAFGSLFLQNQDERSGWGVKMNRKIYTRLVLKWFARNANANHLSFMNAARRGFGVIFFFFSVECIFGSLKSPGGVYSAGILVWGYPSWALSLAACSMLGSWSHSQIWWGDGCGEIPASGWRVGFHVHLALSKSITALSSKIKGCHPHPSNVQLTKTMHRDSHVQRHAYS